jgi:hypothetical protein
MQAVVCRVARGDADYPLEGSSEATTKTPAGIAERAPSEPA